MNEGEVDQIEEDRHEINTKKSTIWAMSVFQDWLTEKNMSSDLLNKSSENLNKMLRSFYPSVQNTNGKAYSSATIWHLVHILRFGK